MSEKNENILSAHFQKHGTVHLIWIIFVLLGALILLASMKLGTDGSIKDILNFAVALSSMVLALVAIVQAIVSSGSVGDTISRVHNAVASIADPAERLSKAADTLSSYSASLDQKATQINSSLDEFRNSLGSKEGATQAREETFSASMLSDASILTKSALYIVLSSYEGKRPYRYYIPENGGEAFEYFVRGYVNALADGFVVGTVSHNGLIEITDLGELKWLPDHRSALITAEGDNQKHLTTMVAEINRAGDDLERRL